MVVLTCPAGAVGGAALQAATASVRRRITVRMVKIRSFCLGAAAGEARFLRVHPARWARLDTAGVDAIAGPGAGDGQGKRDRGQQHDTTDGAHYFPLHRSPTRR